MTAGKAYALPVIAGLDLKVIRFVRMSTRTRVGPELAATDTHSELPTAATPLKNPSEANGFSFSFSRPVRGSTR